MLKRKKPKQMEMILHTLEDLMPKEHLDSISLFSNWMIGILLGMWKL